MLTDNGYNPDATSTPEKEKEYYEILKRDGMKKTEKTINLLEKYGVL
ncbi:MAG TPA: hypothetical protein PLA01_02590 [Acetivibrio sp.]|nr:hypothetical protein [Acetivibrio sp.]